MPFEFSNRKSFDSILDVLRISILHWICPVALDVQEDSNEFAVENKRNIETYPEVSPDIRNASKFL